MDSETDLVLNKEDYEHRQKWKTYMKNLPSYDAKNNGIIPGSRGIVITSGEKWIRNMLLVVLTLRDLGCTLPIQLSYVKGQISESTLDVVRKQNVSVVDMSGR